MKFLPVVFIVVLAMLCHCRKKDNAQTNCTYVPTYIDTTINLNDQNLITLKTKNFAYIKGGFKGVVIHKVSDTEYTAFERASSYQMEAGCQLVVDSSLFFLVDPCSQSRFDFEGFVLKGPAVCPLLEYKTSFIGVDRLRIYYSL